jgi:quinol monooxygenase YgiN
MPTILAHIKTKPGKATRFESILRELVVHTRSSEPNCLRYEYWRGAAPERYYALLSFVDSRAFYEHQASEYHERFVPELLDMFEEFSMEYVDPVENGGSNLPLTANAPLSSSDSAALKDQAQKYPISTQPWWSAMRKESP